METLEFIKTQFVLQIWKPGPRIAKVSPPKCHVTELEVGHQTPELLNPTSVPQSLKTLTSLEKFNCSNSYHEPVFANTMIYPV